MWWWWASKTLLKTTLVARDTLASHSRAIYMTCPSQPWLPHKCRSPIVRPENALCLSPQAQTTQAATSTLCHSMVQRVLLNVTPMAGLHLRSVTSDAQPQVQVPRFRQTARLKMYLNAGGHHKGPGARPRLLLRVTYQIIH